MKKAEFLKTILLQLFNVIELVQAGHDKSHKALETTIILIFRT